MDLHCLFIFYIVRGPWWVKNNTTRLFREVLPSLSAEKRLGIVLKRGFCRFLRSLSFIFACKNKNETSYSTLSYCINPMPYKILTLKLQYKLSQSVVNCRFPWWVVSPQRVIMIFFLHKYRHEMKKWSLLFQVSVVRPLLTLINLGFLKVVFPVGAIWPPSPPFFIFQERLI